jgi:signal transduction histidine kinase
MQKTLFKKYLRIMSLVILISFLILSMVVLIFVSDYWKSDRRALLSKSADSVAQIAATSVITVKRNEYTVDAGRMQAFIMAFATNINSDIFVTDREGNPVLVAYGSGGHLTGSNKQVSADIMKKVLSGRYNAEGTLGGLYDRPYYIEGVPIIVRAQGSQGTVIGAAFAAYNVESLNAFRMDLLKLILMAAVLAFAAAFCIIWLFTYRQVRPLRGMASAARSFGEGNFTVRVPVTSMDEIGQLAVAFNNMADSLSSVEGARRNFIANVSHEFKTPMTTIAGFIDGILDGTIPPEKQRHYLDIVSQEVKRLSRLVRTMLDLSRIDNGELRLRPARFDLTGVVLSALLSLEKPIEDKKIEVRGLENTDSLFVNGDPDMIHQVVYNLLDNAAKFTNEGGYITLKLEEKSDRVTVMVENSGQGIAPEELPMVFDRFYKTDKSRSHDKNGMGLGLYIVKTIIRLHGGDITAESEQNEFCRFTFWLPKKMETPRSDRRMVEIRGEEPKQTHEGELL